MAQILSFTPLCLLFNTFHYPFVFSFVEFIKICELLMFCCCLFKLINIYWEYCTLFKYKMTTLNMKSVIQKTIANNRNINQMFAKCPVKSMQQS